MSRCRSRSRAGRGAFYLADPDAARRRRCGGGGGKKRSKKSKRGKKERKPVRQPYVNTCLSVPYLSAKFQR